MRGEKLLHPLRGRCRWRLASCRLRYRMEIVIATDVLVSIADGDPNWCQDALHKHVRDAKDEIIKRAEDFVKAATSAAE